MTRILVFGTFDALHEGHLDFFRQARELGDEPWLVVSVARDSSVARIKGAPPHLNERERLLRVKTCDLVNDAVLGDEGGSMEHIGAIRPDIIALGYDQENEYVARLPEALVSMHLSPRIARLSAYHPEIYKSSRLRAR